MSTIKKQNGIRVNVINKQNKNNKISIVIPSQTSIAKFKRIVEEQFLQLIGIQTLVSVLEDNHGFVLSNNSEVGLHLNNGDTVYASSHHNKQGNDMNLPSNISDIFVTLRYVSSSVLKRLQSLNLDVSPKQIIGQIIHLGFWYDNSQTVLLMLKILNRTLDQGTIEYYFQQAPQIQNATIFQVILFWFADIKNCFGAFTDIAEQILALLFKMSLTPSYSQFLKGHKLMKILLQISKDSVVPPHLAKASIQIIKNISGKNSDIGNGSKAMLSESVVQFTNIQQVLRDLNSGRQDLSLHGLQQLSKSNKLISQGTVRFDYYCGLMGIFTLKSIKDKQYAQIFNKTLSNIISHTTKQKACDIMQKDIIKRIHNFLLQSHVDTHQTVFQFYKILSKLSVSKGLFNIEQANQFITSPYIQFQKITLSSLAEMMQKKIEPIRFLSGLKDYIRLSLKTDNLQISSILIKIISQLVLDDQCRYQIVNLKGIQIFIKFLQLGQQNNYGQLQRSSAKGLLNLSISSRQIKARVLSLLGPIIQKFYRGSLDSIAGSYIQNILKAPKI